MHVKNKMKDGKDVVGTSCDYLWDDVSDESNRIEVKVVYRR
jgi:hypothetical protein